MSAETVERNRYSDLGKNVTMGDADGPWVWVDELGCEVPSFIDDRLDLVAKSQNAIKGFIRLKHHVPFKMRDRFKPEDWPEAHRLRMGKVDVSSEGYVLCTGINRNDRPERNSGQRCKKLATNRTMFCTAHGGALHPADRKLSVLNSMDVPLDRVQKLDRVQMFMQGFIPWEELDDDEVQGGFIRTSDGRAVNGWRLGVKIQSQLNKELHRRLNEFLKTSTSDMLHVMVDIAKNDMFEPADRIKAAQWVAERTIGKTPEVIVHGTTKAPYESILEGIGSGSREEVRANRQIAVERLAGSNEPIDVESVDLDESGEVESSDRQDDGSEVESNTIVWDQVSSDSSVSETEVVSASAQETAEDIEQRRQDKIARSAAIKKAKQRRFAARATGAKSLDSAAWIIDFKPRRDGKYRAVLVAPNAQTPAVIERIQLKNEKFRLKTEEDFAKEINQRVAREADAEVLRLKTQLAKLTSSDKENPDGG